MSEWKEYILEQVIDKFIDYRGKTPTKTLSGIPLVTAKIVKTGRIEQPNEFIAKQDYETWMTRGFPEVNDVVLTTEAPLGEVALIKDKNIALAQRIITLRTKSALCNSVFLKYYLQSDIGQNLLQARASGSTVEGIKSAELKKMGISLPSLKVQNSIAEILSSLDDKIDLLHRQNKTLEQMAETLFRQWFVEEAGDSGFTTLSHYSDNVRENVSIGDLCKFENYIGLEHVPQKTVTISSWGSPIGLASNKSAFKKNDILFGKLRSYFHKVVFAPVDGVCSTDILVIRPKKPEWFSFCLFWFFNKEVVDYSDLSSGGTRMPRTSWELISQYEIPIPDEEAIVKFESIVRPIIEKMTGASQQINALTQLRDLLLPKLMSGEIAVVN